MNTEKTGKLIANLRKEKDLTQTGLAELIHVSDKAISRWETGRGFPDINNLEALSEALDITVMELINGERMQEPISREEARTAGSDWISIARTQIRKSDTRNLVAGMLLGTILAIILMIHLMSPVYTTDPEQALAVEMLTDGRIVAVLDEDNPGCEVWGYTDEETGENLVFVSCYTTMWDRLKQKLGRGKSAEMVMLGGSEVDKIYYYPTGGEDKLIYNKDAAQSGASDESGGVVSLPRLIYNYWLLLGIGISAVGLAALWVFRKKYFAPKLARIVMLPVAFTISIPLCLIGNFSKVYNAEFYLTGILLLTAVIYAAMMLIARKLTGGRFRLSEKRR